MQAFTTLLPSAPCLRCQTFHSRDTSLPAPGGICPGPNSVIPLLPRRGILPSCHSPTYLDAILPHLLIQRFRLTIEPCRKLIGTPRIRVSHSDTITLVFRTHLKVRRFL